MSFQSFPLAIGGIRLACCLRLQSPLWSVHPWFLQGQRLLRPLCDEKDQKERSFLCCMKWSWEADCQLGRLLAQGFVTLVLMMINSYIYSTNDLMLFKFQIFNQDLSWCLVSTKDSKSSFEASCSHFEVHEKLHHYWITHKLWNLNLLEFF